MPLETTLELPVFQGPLDLLLDLIERRRLAITDVSLALVADQYLQAVRALPEPDPDVLGEFLLIAARLLLLKSRALLPQTRVDDEEQESADDLTARLEAYRRIKQAALHLAARFDKQLQAFPHPARLELRELQPDLAPIEAAILARLWRTITRRQPPAPLAEATLQPRIPVAARLLYLRDRLKAERRLTWDQVAGESLDEWIATFLAVLELVRQSELRVRQDQAFGPLLLDAADALPGGGSIALADPSVPG